MDRTIDMLLRNLRSEITRLTKDKILADGLAEERRLQLVEIHSKYHMLVLKYDSIKEGKSGT